jgi:thioester reductase-like protein
MNRTESSQIPDGAAVIGMAGRFPGAPTVAEFWRNLRDGLESVRVFSEDELAAAGIGQQVSQRPDYVPAKPVLDRIEDFDAEFFRISPREAALTDPQHRIFLECAWEALEDAGHDSWTQPGRIGVFASAGKNTYLLFHLLGETDWPLSEEVFQLLIGNEKDYLATRVAYLLNLTGPAVTVQTACSSSLVAVHMACQSLALGECDIALAGGVSVDVPRVSGYVYRPHGILSPDGHCRAFAAAAAGTLFGQGAGVVILRRAVDALADGDTIRAVVRGSAVNNDGARRVGFTAPSEEGQAEVVAEALAVAGVTPDSIGYVEAHGTATPIGDLIEVRALTRAFRSCRKESCPIGSVKTNVGHLGAAAGVAGFIKTVLALEHRELPPSLHCHSPNPQIDFPSTPFFVNTERRAWATDGRPRRAGVSSFGQGGTNAHVVLEEAPFPATAAPSRPWHVLTISARTPAAREEAARRLAEALRTSPHDLADIAYTLHVGRRSFEYRRIVVCRTKEEAAAALELNDAARVADARAPTSERLVAFLVPPIAPGDFHFPESIAKTERAFREAFEECACLHPAAVADGQSTEPARVFATQYALAKLWMSWGVQPQTVLGGAGTALAGVLRGEFSLRDALVSARAPDAGPAPPPLDPPAGYVPLVIAPTGNGLASYVAGQVEFLGGSELIQVLGFLWLHGAAFDRAAYYAGESRRRVSLPTYPFQRRRYWVPAVVPAPAVPAPGPRPVPSSDDVEAVIARAIGSALGVETVGLEDDFFDLGGNSLLGIQVIARVADDLGVRLSPEVLFDCPTVAALAELIREGTPATEPNRTAWAQAVADIYLEDEILAVDRSSESPPPGRVLLTGATGFFGTHVLEELLRSSNVDITCLVRAQNADQARERVVRAMAYYGVPCDESFTRVRAIPADLKEKQFGLSDGDYSRLAESVHSIIHCGAQVNFVRGYAELRRANVGGTREVLRLATTAQVKPVHHVSSVAVFQSEAFAGGGRMSEDEDLSASRGFFNGYDLSKWASERLVALARARSLPVSIYRLGNIAGHSARGVMSPDHIIVRFVQGCIQLGLAPGEDNTINVIPVDAASRMLVDLARRRPTTDANFHLVNPAPTRVREVIGWLVEQGYRIETCSEAEWRDAIRKVGVRNVFAPFLLLLSERSLFSNRSYDYSRAKRQLGSAMDECPPFDRSLFAVYLAYLIRVGYLPRP